MSGARLAVLAALAVVVAFVAACSAGAPAAPSRADDVAAATIPPAPPSPQPAASQLPPVGALPTTISDLFDTRVLPTCSLNGGVCHSGKNYPDLRDLGALEDLVGRPCGVNVDADFPDACEPQGDRLVAGALDVGILRADGATITTDADVPLGPIAGAVVKRTLASGTFMFDASAARLEATAPRTITIRAAPDDVRAFLTPSLPLREDHVQPADVNGNGIAGASLGWREIVPGRPERSWIVARLWDTSANPELMPRQCRAWDDDATRALACWIEGLRPDRSNVFADIDYARCTFTLPSAGRCGTGLTPERIVDAQCAGCHGADAPAEGLDLRSASLRTATVGVASRERPDMLLIDPGKPEASYLFLKITSGPPATSGELMPRGGKLADAQIEALRAWIESGAP